ncbi:MAG: hypothetical protein NUW37_09550 [Planctomycetes bacterium]|nr:hypothetical protein [Planctomycetota bacterium]
MTNETSFLTPKQRIENIADGLRKLGYSDSSYFIARLLCVTLTTVENWLANTRNPNVRHTTRIGLLTRLINKANDGDTPAKETLRKMSAKDAPDILALGYQGFLAVTGLGWSMSLFEEGRSF